MTHIPKPNQKLPVFARNINPRNMYVDKDGKTQLKVPLEVHAFFAQLLNHIGRRSDYFATCITCKHWKGHKATIFESKIEETGEQEHCSKFNVLPPLRVIVDGCEHYEDGDETPF